MDRVALTRDDLLAFPDFRETVREQTGRLFEGSKNESRLAAAFSNQQRWLMSHIGLALFYRAARDEYAPGLNITTFTDEVARLGIASRNTADAYVKELLNYGYLQSSECEADRRSKPLRPNPIVISLYTFWTVTHLQTLDCLQPQRRAEWFMRDPSVLSCLQPRIASRLVERRNFHVIGAGFSLLTWLDSGAHLMDIITQQCAPHPGRPGHIVCAPVPTSEIATRLGISRPHLSRKLREGERHGAIGWMGLPGKSSLWVGPQFLADYYEGQAIKLEAVEEAWAELR